MKKIGFVAPDDVEKMIADNLYENRLKNQTESIVDLIRRGYKEKKKESQSQ